MSVTDSDWRDVILSVGTHHGKRRLAPLEVARVFRAALAEDRMSSAEVGKKVKLTATMVNRIARLADLDESCWHLVDWKKCKSAVVMSAASEIARLPSAEQSALFDAALEHGLTKSEIIQTVQIRQRSGKTLTSCLDDVLRMRRSVERTYLFVGRISDQRVQHRLAAVKQSDRDALLQSGLRQAISYPATWSGKLGVARFSLVGNGALSRQLASMVPDFETVIAELIAHELDIYAPSS